MYIWRIRYETFLFFLTAGHFILAVFAYGSYQISVQFPNCESESAGFLDEVQGNAHWSKKANTQNNQTNHKKQKNKKTKKQTPKKEDYVCCKTHPIQASPHPY